ncbi:hypothetical protein SOVF_154770 [Spinacia oleracea]|uniref:UPF0496 protein At4g34320-like isoform X1 n=1 Tax=Spinacia oleracea TaxID=3562 RepID=A0ABM3RN61_SPIOL|nr:UPF0496 protein At4g34320-like isoform X1 [Spinacia oleracea]KNA09311.1 hypothetical protein SOVF_154770 [Spinacia oleracea]
MGAKFSKDSNNANPPSIDQNTNTQMNNNNGELSSYLQACQLDPDVQVFDSQLHERTTHIINSLTNNTNCSNEEGGGIEVRSVSLDSLRQVAGCLIDMNQEVVRVILECKKDIWNNQELFGLVQDYFEYSVQTLDFFTALDKCLKRVRDRQLIIQVALLQFEEGFKDNGGNFSGKILQELRGFKEADDPFTEEFFTMFQSVYKQQIIMFEKLQIRKHKLDKKLKSLKIYRKVSNIIFAATFITVIICSVVAAAISAPPLVSGLAAAASAPMGGIGRWMNTLWKKYEIELKTQKELINSMQIGTYIAIKDLDSIRVLVDKLEVQVESMLGRTEIVLTQEGDVSEVIEEIKKKQTEFLKAIDDLGEHGNKYSRDIRRARTVILQRIIKHPNDD